MVRLLKLLNKEFGKSPILDASNVANLINSFAVEHFAVFIHCCKNESFQLDTLDRLIRYVILFFQSTV